MTCTIEIYGPMSMIKGDFPYKEVRKATSYMNDGAVFSRAFKKGLWDGRTHLLDKKTNAFPTGLLGYVTEVLVEHEIEHEVIDHRVVPVPAEAGIEFDDFTLRDYQVEVCKSAAILKQGIIKVATGGGKTSISVAITKDLHLNTLFLVTSKELLYQAEAEFRELLKIPDDSTELGLVGDGHWNPGKWVTVAIIDTVHSRLGEDECKELLQSTDVLFADECHGVGADQYYDVAVNCPAYYRFACSGTPYDRTDSAGLRLIGAFGHTKIANVTTRYLVDRGFLPRAQVIFDRVSVPALKKGTAYPTAYKKGVVENEALQAKVVAWTVAAQKAGLSTLILIEEINHGRLLDEALWGAEDFIPHMFVHGTEKDRASILKDFSDRKLPVLISSSILDVGVSIDSIDCLILAGSKKSKIKTVQRIGRGLRGDKLVVVEFANFTNKHLLKHSMTRLQDYKGEECFDIHQSKEPSPEFIKKLYDLSDRKLRKG